MRWEAIYKNSPPLARYASKVYRVVLMGYSLATRELVGANNPPGKCSSLLLLLDMPAQPLRIRRSLLGEKTKKISHIHREAATHWATSH